MKRLIFIAGGTGGHLFPALCLAEFIAEKDRNMKIYFVGRKNSVEERIISEKFPFFGISLKRASEVKPWDYIKAYLEGRRILKKLKPHLLIVFGSYISIPILIEAIIKRYPFFLHEQNVIPGRVVRIFAPFARGVAISFLETKRYIKNRNIFHTGNFVREELLTKEKEKCKKELGFEENKKLLIVTGGSQGARRINEIMKGVIPKLLSMGWQILHQIGFNNYDDFVKDIPEEWKDKGYKPVPFINNMEVAIKAGDFAISRAGATTIYQFLLAGLPAIYIPYPYAKDNHQEVNAKLIVENGCGEIIKEENITIETLLKKILEWDEKRISNARERCKSMVIYGARERFFEIIYRYLEGRN
jgi:UDP-N-acetylglucosamine--N-acetylmuramyl-(pentapeptide) pyrophosphoryl-undecaprenol N-acetylglucosamine transferase